MDALLLSHSQRTGETMNKVEQFAVEQFGWTEEEFGTVKYFLNDMRDMLIREIHSILNKTATAETYGFSDDETFLKNNRRLIGRIDTELGFE